MNKKLLISIISVAANILLALGKVSVGLISRSAAIIADGINSTTDVLASIIGYIGIKAAEKPADKEHPYGHGKAEVISGFIITIIIFISGLWIIYDAIKGFLSPFDNIQINYLAFGVMAFSAFVNSLMSYIKIKYGKKYDSITLVSDGVHSRIDFIVSLGIFAGLFLTRFYPNIDSILALAVGLYILKEAIGLGKESTDLLMGRSADEETENKIKNIIKEKGLALKDLKTQKKGSFITANINIRLPSNVKVDKAAEISRSLKEELMQSVDNLNYIAVQVESLDFSESYYQPPSGLGRSIMWNGKMGGKALGPGGECTCPRCGKTVPHEKGTPCYKMRCPECDTQMKRK